MIYNLNKLKQILPVKSDQSMDCVVNGLMDSSILPEIFSCLKTHAMEKNQLKWDKKNEQLYRAKLA